MDINQIYDELDSLKYTEIEEYLAGKIATAESEGIFEIVVPLLNEMIGFLRDTTQYDKGRTYKQKLMGVLAKYNQQGTMNYATSLLNIANFDRAAGSYEDSLNEYRQCEEIYKSLLREGDYLWAGLYNNESLLYQMMGDNLAAIGALSNALRIVEAIPEREIEVATTYTNIAQSLAALGQMDEAFENVKVALDIFAKFDNKDYHYSAAAAVMGIIAYNRGDYKEAAHYYNEAAEVVKSIMGENDNYHLLISNRDAMISMLPKNDSTDVNDTEQEETAEEELINQGGLSICHSFFNKYGKSLIKEKFADYEDRIAVGLFGEGSECLGFDDEISQDHDWGPGFMLLVSREVYASIGTELEKAYMELPEEYLGFRRINTSEAQGRTGVIVLEEYLKRYLGEALVEDNGELHIDRSLLIYVPEFILSNMVNGEIWTDKEGIITRIRQEISEYYDNTTWKKKLGYELIRMGQSGQYNLERCLKRNDRVAAGIYLGEYYKSTLKVVYLLNRRYAPYEKWLLKGASGLDNYAEITDCLKAMADMDLEDKNLLMSIEIVAQVVLAALKDNGLVNKDEQSWFLERLGKEIL